MAAPRTGECASPPPAVIHTDVMISQSSHLDWDWLLAHVQLLNNQPPTPLGYFNGQQNPAFEVLAAAAGYLKDSPSTGYRYSLSEVTFMRDFAAAHPTSWAVLANASLETWFQVVGACLDTPDTVLPHGEAIIRNYLLGGLWARHNVSAQAVYPHAWLPDSFGHDPELPVLLEAMGMEAVCFARVPGDIRYNGGKSPQFVAAKLTECVEGDAVWVAGDGSEALMHWLPHTYTQDLGDIGTAAAANAPSSPLPVLFMPVGDDFGMPDDVPGAVERYNAGKPGVRAQVGTFPMFVRDVLAPNRATLPRLAGFNPNPYHSGGYVTFPPLKELLQRATRALLAAEVYSLIAGPTRPYPPAALDAAWEPVALSTSHNIIPGGALPAVYTGEQRPLLEQAAATAEALRDTAARAVAARVAPQSNQDGLDILVLNPLGFARGGLVEVPAAEVGALMANETCCVQIAGTTVSAQTTGDGSIMFVAPAGAVGSMGYLRATLVQWDDGTTGAVSVTPPANGRGYLLRNELVEVEIAAREGVGWGLAGVWAVQGSGIGANMLGGVANTLALYQDVGSGFNFGNEPTNGFSAEQRRGTITAGAARVVETGPVRVRLETQVTWKEEDGAANQERVFVAEYTLVSGEPYLRMSLTGSAPFRRGTDTDTETGYSVFVEFPFSAPVAAVAHATPSHWRQAAPTRLWTDGPALEPTRDFVAPLVRVDGWQPLGVLYHGSVHGWGTTTHGAAPAATLVGGVLRNVGTGNFDFIGATHSHDGNDPETHTVRYALRVPDGLGAPATGAPQREAAAYQAPLQAVRVALQPTSSGQQAVAESTRAALPNQLSLVTVSAAGGAQPVIEALKRPAGQEKDVLLRVRTAGNQPVDVTVDASGLATAGVGSADSVQRVTALETEIPGVGEKPVGKIEQIPLHAGRALTTFRIFL